MSMAKICVCGALCRTTPCPRCSPKKINRNYDYQWRKTSERVRVERPLCQDCWDNGRVTPSSEVHHIVPIDQDPRLKLVESNLVALCHDCHEKRHEK